MNNYELVFDGTISEGHQIEDVKKKLAALLKANDEQIELLFSKPEVIIKKNMDYESAVNYQKALQKAGTVCKVMDAAQNQVAVQVEKAAPASSHGQFIDHAASPPTLQFADTAVMDAGETTLPKDLHNPASQMEATKEPVNKKIGRGIGDIVAGVVLIGIGLLWGGSIFLGTADIIDIFFDCLGLFWIGKGVYKMIS